MANKTNCKINGKEYYRIRKKIGEDANGKPVMKAFYGINQKDANKQVVEYLASQKLGTVDKKEYFSQLLDYYINDVMMKSSLSDGSKSRYRSAYNTHIKNTDISFIRMKDINSRIIQKYYNDLASKGKPVEMINKVLSRFFKYAESEGYCNNPLGTVEITKNKKTDDEIIVFTHEEVKAIMHKPTPNNQYRAAYIFALGTGVRMGELVALKWTDIKDGEVSITKQAVYDVDGKLVIDGVKTENSVRSIPIPDFVKKELKKHKHDGELIFQTTTGTMIDKSNLRISFLRFLKSIGVEEKSFHTLRKTYCTMLCESGVPIQTASKLMGHSSISVTAKYYTFVSNKEKLNAAQKLNKTLSKL
jgi:integrase